MRKLFWAILVLAALYAGYWLVGSRALKHALDNWVETERADGVTVDYDSLTVQGFPSRFDVSVSNLDFYDPHSGMGWKTPFFQALALSYQPQHYIAVWDHSQTLRLPIGDVGVRSDDLRASLVFTPGLSFQLNRMSLVGAGMVIDPGDGLDFAAKTLRFATEKAPISDYGHHIGLDVAELRMPRLLREQWDLGGDMPDTLDHLHLDATLDFDGPLDRHAIEDTPPQITHISVAPSAVTWGPLDLRLSGDIAVDAGGQLDGSLTIEASQWRRILDLAVKAGLVPEANRAMVEAALTFAAAASPDPENFSAPLTFSGGKMSIGALPLGAAPVLKLQ
ncbi:DUF2125 domain-containing protein [Frigidibacter sp. ROC022]|uniref:DUF2125 domain-containing protein n=1 Tax=Frigidibacter sp. ROC022 TaxID=2971796 RepID=UPI00215B7117|nr:DUF2125 domain-containing protein [Frigidibacter sp. ROC022]MCR8722919.1 DUF2125 domain-containing protein [Frigidibacter sp. ROC022]